MRLHESQDLYFNSSAVEMKDFQLKLMVNALIIHKSWLSWYGEAECLSVGFDSTSD